MIQLKQKKYKVEQKLLSALDIAPRINSICPTLNTLIIQPKQLRQLFKMDYSLENHKDYIGKHVSELPTPSLVVNLPVLKTNVETLHRDVEKLGIGFRPHVKTLKVCCAYAIRDRL